MSIEAVLSEKIPSYADRKRAIEAEPLPPNVGAVLDLAAQGSGDEPALHFFEESSEAITYGELLSKVNRLANGLAARGVTRGVHVGVMLPNIAQFPITWLALAKLGAVMIPINSAYTQRELAYILDDGDAKFLVIHRDSVDMWRTLSADKAAPARDKVFVVDSPEPGLLDWDELLRDQPEQFVSPGIELDDLLNIQYTSGTTGFPKGCMLTHRYWLTSGKQNAFRDGRSYRRILASTPFFYMDPQWLLLMAFYRKGCLFVARRQSASKFMDWVRDYRIQFTLMIGPDVILKQPPSPGDRQHELIRANVYGLSKDNHQRFEQRFDVCAREAFGMTEIGSGLFMPMEAIEMIGSGSCGIPTPFREAYVADAEGKMVQDGKIGELLVRGPGIMRGYYKKPEASAKAFHGDWFRTGDLFRRDKKGFFYIVGRQKDMIRRSGENIAAHEVESVLLAVPQVAEAAVLPVRDEARGEEVKAYIVLQPGIDGPGALSSIIDHCQRNLAPFKVPRYYAFRPSLDKTASGKISKPTLLAEAADLRAGSFDRASNSWLATA